MKRALLLLGFVLSLGISAAAQDPNDLQMGLGQYWSFDKTDIDAVNLSTGALSVGFPILSYPQIANMPPLEISIRDNSGFWEQLCYTDDEDNYYCNWYPDVPSPTLSFTPSISAQPCDNPCYALDDSGAAHQLEHTGSTTMMAIDGSGIRVETTSGGASITSVKDANGIGYNLYGSDFLSDPHGNGFTGSGEYTLVDTIGRDITQTTENFLPVDGCTETDYPGPPNHTSVPVTVCYSLHGVSTDFGIWGVTEFSNSWEMLDSVTLPNGQSWSFTYDSLGNLNEIEFPTGRTISYTWTNKSNSDGSITEIVAARTINDGSGGKEWQYAYTSDFTDSLTYTTTVTDPDTDKTVHTFTWFCGNTACTSIYYENFLEGSSVPYETEADYYQGSVSSTNLLKTVNTYYAGGPNAPAGVGPGTNNFFPYEVTTTWPNNQVSKVCTVYENETNSPCSSSISFGSAASFYWLNYGYGTAVGLSTGRPIQVWEYDYNTSSAGSLLRETVTAYQSDTSSYRTANLLNLPSSVTVYDGSSNTKAKTTYAYDESGSSSCSSSAPCGDLTTENVYTGTSTYLTTHMKYDSHGMSTKLCDPNDTSCSNPTQYSYDSSGAYLSEVQYPTTNGGTTHNEYFTFDDNTGLMTAHTDQNGTGTSYKISYNYDSVRRPVKISFPDGGLEQYCYTDEGGSSTDGNSGMCSSGSAPFKLVFSRKITSTATFSETVSTDGIGRPTQAAVTVPSSTCPSGVSYVDKTYDGEERLHTVSNADCTSSSSDDVNITYSYNALNMVTNVQMQDGGNVAISNADDSASHTYCATITDEVDHKRKNCKNGIDQMTRVWEDPSGSNFETDYSYDPMGNMLQVQQKGGDSNSSHWRTRTSTYDLASRLTQAVNPESGTVNYAYDSDSNCSYTFSGESISKTDARSVRTCMQHDALHRLTEKSYSDSTPTINYVYDGDSLPSGCSVSSFSYGSYPKPHRTAMCDQAGSEAWSYDPMGRPGNDQRTTDSVTKTSTYTYNYDGSLYQLANPAGRTVTYGVNVAEQPTSAADSSSVTYIDSAIYEPYGALSSLSYGSSGIPITTLYYNSRLQPCRIAVNSSGTAPTSCGDTTSGHGGNPMDLVYCFNSNMSSSDRTNHSCTGSTMENNGNVAQIWNYATSGRTQNFTYDGLNRIATAYSEGNIWGETYDIDAWGNLNEVDTYDSKPQPDSLNQSVDTSTNRFTDICSSSCYDANGNVINDSSHTYTYDAENHIVQVDSGSTATYYYDGDGRRVRKSSSVLYWYDTDGDVLDETDTSGTLTDEYVFLGGQRIARRDSSANVVYYFADHLGSARVVTNSSGSVLDDLDFCPYGRVCYSAASSSGNTFLFTGKERDSETGLDNFGARYYSSQQLLRFMSPDWSEDPEPVPYAYFGDPQTLNLYSYVRNNPLNFIDIDGHIITCVSTTTTSQYTSIDEDGLFGETYTVTQTLTTCQNSPDPSDDLGSDAGLISKNTPLVPPQMSSQTPQAPSQPSCPAVPPHPPGADVDRNIAMVEAQQITAPGDPAVDGWWLGNVVPHGVWDYKRQGSRYDAFGNFNFGATGAAMGFSLDILWRGAGIPKIGQKVAPGNPLTHFPYGNQPGKQNDIGNGFQYYVQGCNKGS